MVWLRSLHFSWWYQDVPCTSILLGNRSKYAMWIARQAALSSQIGISTTWELSTNLILDKLHPNKGISLRQLLMSIPFQVFLQWPLFHFLNRQWRSEKGVSFGFTPENEPDARTIIAGLIPYLRDTAENGISLPSLRRPYWGILLPNGTLLPDKYILQKRQWSRIF